MNEYAVHGWKLNILGNGKSSASEMTYIVSSGALNSTHSLNGKSNN